MGLNVFLDFPTHRKSCPCAKFSDEELIGRLWREKGAFILRNTLGGELPAGQSPTQATGIT